MSATTHITSAGSATESWRRLQCGCWQTLIHGDIVTSSDERWITVVPCIDHKAA